MQFYKPNSSNSGNAVGFSFNSKEGALYVQFVKQTGPKSFKGGAKFNIKFSDAEIGAILNVIERDKEPKQPLFHQSEKGSTSIRLENFPKPKEGAAPAYDGFTISVIPRAIEGGTNEKFGFWFNSAEERVLKEYLQFVLHHFFTAEYSAEKQRRQAATGSKAEKVDKPDPLA